MAGYFPDSSRICLLPLHERLPPKEIKEGVQNLHTKCKACFSIHYTNMTPLTAKLFKFFSNILVRLATERKG